MSATVPSGDSQTIGSGEVGFTEQLNVAGEYNIRGEFNFDGPVTGALSSAQNFDGVLQAVGTITSSIDIVTSEPIIAGTFGPEVTPLTIDLGQALSVTAGSSESDAPVNVAGELNLSGELALFDEDSSIVFSSDKSGSAQADFEPALAAGVITQTAQAITQPFAPTLSATGDNEPLGTQETSGIFLAQPTYDGNPAPPGLLNAAYDATGDPISATSDVAPVVWQVTINQTEVVDDVFDVEVIDTANPFGSYAVVYADDVTGNTFEKFSRGTRVDIAYSDNQGISFENRFSGYVVEAREYDDSGSDTLEVECYTFDQFLRRNTVSNDLTGLTITQALASIIQNDTPVEFVSDNVDVGSEQTLSRSYQGEQVEDVLRALSFASVNEEFGVNDDVEFFFRPRESEHNARGVDNTRWLNYDIPELGKDAVNEVRVFFDDGNRTVVVDDGNDQKNLQESLALESAGKQAAEISRPDITSIGDAEDEGRRYLEERTSILTGTVTTFGLYDLEPGDTIDIEIQPRGISDEFRVAEVRYHWGRSETELTIVQKRGTSDDILFRISSSLKRIETAGADRTAIEDKILKNEYRLLVEPVDNESKFDDIRVTNTALNLLRDGVIDETTITIDEVRWGDDASNLSRTNTDLEGTQVAAFSADTGNWQADVSVFNTLGLSYESSETATAKEVGLFDDGGNLLIRAVSDAGVRANEIDLSITFENDPEVERTVVTDTGQQLFRDTLADNNPAFLEQYRVGRGDPDSAGFEITETDTDLDDDFLGGLGKTDLDTLLIESLSSESDWENAPEDIVFNDNYPIDGPFTAAGGGSSQLNLVRNSYWVEAEDADTVNGQVNNWSAPPAASNFESVRLTSAGDGASHTFILDMDHDPEKTTMHVGTFLDDFAGTFEYRVNGKVARTSTFSGTTSGQWSPGGTAFLGLPGGGDISQAELSKGSSIDVEFQITSISSGEVYIDFMALNDELDRDGIDTFREVSPYDATLFRVNSVPILQSYNPVPLPLKTITSPISFDEVAIDATVVGSSGFVDTESFNAGPETEFKIKASNDGGNTTLESVNNTTPTFSFASDSTELDLEIQLDGYWDDIQSPAGATGGMALNTLSVSVGVESLKRSGVGGVNARAIFRPQTITAGGEEVTEGGLFDTDGNMVCRTIAIAPFDPGSDTRVSTDDTITLVGV